MAANSPERWPVGLIAMLVMVGAIEFRLGLREGSLMGSFEVEWREMGRAVRIARGSTVVAMGDSLAKNGVLPTHIEPRLGPGRSMYNLAISGSPMPVTYFLLRRMVESGHIPEALVLDGQTLTFSPKTPTGPLPWHALLRIRELADVAWSFGDPGFFAENAGRKLIPSWRHRAMIRDQMIAALTGTPCPDPKHFWLFIANWNRNKGALVLPDRPKSKLPREDQHNPRLMKALAGEWKVDRFEDEYTERFLALAASRGVRVYWLMMPDEPILNALRTRDGWWSTYAAYLRNLQSRYSNLFVVDGHAAPYPAESMADVVHMSRTGALVFSEALAAILAKKPAARWLMLPSYDPALARSLADRSPIIDVNHQAQRVLAAAGNAGETARR